VPPADPRPGTIASLDAPAAALERCWGLVPPILLAVLPFVVFAPATAMREVFAAQDIQAYFYPYHVVPARMLANGHLPLWNPYVFSGMPLVGDGQTALFYPPNWLFFLLPPETALNLVVLLQFSIAGVGAYQWGRALGLWVVPATAGALAFMFCGFLSARIVHLSIMSGAALLPWIFVCLERLMRARGRHALAWAAALAVALALQAVTGHPQVPVYTAVAAALFVLVRVAASFRSHGGLASLGSAALVALAYALGYALAAVQLVPWFELARLSVRAAGTPYEFVFGSSTTGADWLLFLFPYLLGAHAESAFAAGPIGIEQSVRIWEHSAYVGVLPIALAIVGIGHLVELVVRGSTPRAWPVSPGPTDGRVPRRASLVFLVMLLVLGVLMAAGWHTPFSQVIYATPVLGSLRAVERALVLAAFALATLAGFGLQRIVDAPSRLSWLLWPACLVVAVPAGFVLHAWLRPGVPLLGIPAEDLARLSVEKAHTAVPLLLAAAAGLVLAWWSRRPAGRIAVTVALGIIVVDLAVYAASFTPTASRRMYRLQPQVLHHLPPGDSLFRKATVIASSNDIDRRSAQHTLALSWGMVYGVEDVNGFNSLQPRRYTDYLFGTGVDDVSYGYLRDERLFREDDPVLSSLNVRYVLVPSTERIRLGAHLRQVFDNGRVQLYENPHAYPRAYFSEQVRVVPDARAVLQRVRSPGFDGRREALVESPLDLVIPPATGTATAYARRPGPNELVVETSTSETRFLVTSEMHFPGWRAYVGDVETPIHRTNYLFRGVVVPPGRHVVRFEYRPQSVLAGALVSLFAVAALSGLMVWSWRRGRRSPS
jgi:hypothetical protein